jgi:hypothetical protein
MGTDALAIDSTVNLDCISLFSFVFGKAMEALCYKRLCESSILKSCLKFFELNFSCPLQVGTKGDFAGDVAIGFFLSIYDEETSFKEIFWTAERSA